MRFDTVRRAWFPSHLRHVDRRRVACISWAKHGLSPSHQQNSILGPSQDLRQESQLLWSFENWRRLASVNNKASLTSSSFRSGSDAYFSRYVFTRDSFAAAFNVLPRLSSSMDSAINKRFSRDAIASSQALIFVNALPSLTNTRISSSDVLPSSNNPINVWNTINIASFSRPSWLYYKQISHGAIRQSYSIIFPLIFNYQRLFQVRYAMASS